LPCDELLDESELESNGLEALSEMLFEIEQPNMIMARTTTPVS
jgi:hypothetical protein